MTSAYYRLPATQGEPPFVPSKVDAAGVYTVTSGSAAEKALLNAGAIKVSGDSDLPLPTGSVAVAADPATGAVTQPSVPVNLVAPFAAITPLTGDSDVIPDGVSAYIVNAAGTIAALTLAMPANPVDGQRVNISTTHTVTTLTLNASAGQTLLSPATTLTVATPAEYLYSSGATPNSPATTWVRTK